MIVPDINDRLKRRKTAQRAIPHLKLDIGIYLIGKLMGLSISSLLKLGKSLN